MAYLIVRSKSRVYNIVLNMSGEQLESKPKLQSLFMAVNCSSTIALLSTISVNKIFRKNLQLLVS